MARRPERDPAAGKTGDGTRTRAGKALLGEPRLATVDVVGQSLGQIAPIIGAGFAAFLLAGVGGAVAPFVILLVFAGSLFFGWAVSLYGRRYAGVGGIYEYLVRVHGDWVGVAAAVALYGVGLTFTGGAIYALEGELWKSFASAHVGFDPPWWAAALVAAGIGSLAAYLGVRLSTRAQLFLTTISAIPFLLLVFVVILEGGDSGNTLSVFDPSNEARGDVFEAILFGIVLFAGFESAAVLGEETARPHSSIPRAFLIAISLVGIFFVSVVYAGTIGFGPDKAATEWGSDPVGFSTLGDRYVGSPLGLLIELAVIIDVLVLTVAVSNSIARGVFALGRDGMLPRWLATRSRHQTPVAGILTVTIFGLAGLAVAATFGDRFEFLSLLVIGYTLVLILVYIALVIGAARIVVAERRAVWRLIGVALAATVPALGLYGQLHPFPEGSERWGVWIATAGVVGAVAWVLTLRARRPEILHHAAEHSLQPSDAQLDREASAV